MSKKLAPKKLTPKQLMRYSNPIIIDHIASHYVLGTLSTHVHNRAEQLMHDHPQLAARINHWQQNFITMDKQTAEVVPKDSTWQAISAQIEHLSTTQISDKSVDETITQQPVEQPVKKNNAQRSRFDLVSLVKQWFTLPSYRLMHVASIVVIFLLSFALLNPNEQGVAEDSLSYIAVLTDQNKQAQLVASTYGESKKLVVNMINTPDINAAEDLELWVVSKTDQQARSLGVIPRDVTLLEQQLSEAQWRLIKDSDSLIVTIEDLGGSPIGEPSDIIVSRGLCVRLKEWKKNA